MSVPLLVIGVGNPSRGDDALGPLAIERLAALNPPGVELIVDFQLQVDHALDLLGREEVVFVDASVSASAPFAFTALAAAKDHGFSTHALSPAAVLAVGARYYAVTPKARQMAIRGYRFALGEGLSAAAAANLEAAVARLADYLRRKPPAGAAG